MPPKGKRCSSRSHDEFDDYNNNYNELIDMPNLDDAGEYVYVLEIFLYECWANTSLMPVPWPLLSFKSSSSDPPYDSPESSGFGMSINSL